ncbi:cation:proton antiporter [Candidatus Poribacteria bacterium]|nr:MAG: cation:proton antiporter [Candidatus Poribacteria bacterium]
MVLILGLCGAKGIKALRFPQVVGYVLAGVILGPSILKLLSLEKAGRYDVLSFVALGIIGFIIGSELALRNLRGLGKAIAWIVPMEAGWALLLVGLGSYLLTRNAPLSVLLGALASATAPAGTVDVLQEYRAKGPVTTTLYAIVGLDDAFALMAYGFCLPLAESMLVKMPMNLMTVLVKPLEEIALSIGLGALIGAIALLPAGRLRLRSEILAFSLGMIFLASGLAVKFHLSLILTTMSMAVVMVNLRYRLCRRIAEALNEFAVPIYICFFVLVGGRLNIALLPKMGVIGLAYIALREAGKYFGTYLGATLGKADEKVRRYAGFGLFSQAGVAIGVALSIYHELSRLGEAGVELGRYIITLITATTLVVQLIGPPFVKLAIVKSGEAGKGGKPEE